MAARQHKLQIYGNEKKGYRWRVLHKNGKITANGGQAYSRKIDLEDAFISMATDLCFIGADILFNRLEKRAKKSKRK